MIRLVASASLAAGAAALVLYQFQGTTELAFWEVLILVLVFLQYRSIPERGDPLSTPLFRLPDQESVRLPRTLASLELAVIDSTTGYVSPNRRIRPIVDRIARHRLGHRGLDLDSPQAKATLGEAQWLTLMNTSDDALTTSDLEALVTEIEKL